MMSNPLKVSIQLIILILKLFTHTAETLETMETDLDIICGYLSGDNKPPAECSCVAVATNNHDALNVMNSVKGNLPALLIDQTNTYDIWPDVVKQKVNVYLDPIKTFGVNYVAFDNTYKSQVNMTKERPNFSQDLATFFDNAKKIYTNIGFGLVLNTNISWLKESLDVGLLNKHVDFFLLDSATYRFCEHQNYQKDMNTLATKDDIMGSFTELKTLGVDMAKLVYTISLQVQSAYDDLFTYQFESMSYTRLCSKKMSKHRKYCFNTIQNLFDKARLHLSEKTLGIYVQGTDDDDIDGSCQCTTKNDPTASFRGFKTIAGASIEGANDVSFYECTQGAFPKIVD